MRIPLFLLICICLAANVSGQITILKQKAPVAIDSVTHDIDAMFAPLQKQVDVEFGKQMLQAQTNTHKLEDQIRQINEQMQVMKNKDEVAKLEKQKMDLQKQILVYDKQINNLEKQQQVMMTDLEKQKQKALQEAKAAKLKTPAQYQAALKTINVKNTEYVNNRLKKVKQ